MKHTFVLEKNAYPAHSGLPYFNQPFSAPASAKYQEQELEFFHLHTIRRGAKYLIIFIGKKALYYKRYPGKFTGNQEGPPRFRSILWQAGIRFTIRIEGEWLIFCLSKHTLLAFILATLAGACLHFLYVLFPNPVTALVAPVNESLWEHLKLLYWPYLAAVLALNRQEGHTLLGQRCFSLLLAAALMQMAGYVYHILLGGSSLTFDIGLFVLLMAAAFFLPCFLHGTVWETHRDLFVLLTAALGFFLVIFTFLPPRLILFTDLSGIHSWRILFR